MKVELALTAIITMTIPTTAPASVLATCHASAGKSFFLSGEVGWVDDGIRGGSIILTADADGRPDVVTRDASGATFSVTDDGAQVIPTGIDAKNGTFTYVAIWKATSVVETYQLSKDATGKRRLLWTSNKNGMGTRGMVKMSAFVADCDNPK